MNIYVAKFDTAWKNEDLAAVFSPFGEVASARVEIDVFTDKSRGFGYVEMPDETAAKAAIASLNETEIKGCVLSVQQAEPKVERKGSYKVGNGGVNPYRFRKN